MRTIGIALLALGLLAVERASAVPITVFGIDFEANKAATELVGELQLTPPIGGQRGSAFALTPFQIGTFSTQFDFRITGGADGLSFVIQNDPAKADALGTAGNSLGLGDETPSGSLNQQISPSIAVTFDTFGNPNASNTVHIVQNGDITAPLAVSLAPVMLNDGVDHTAVVSYDAVTKVLSVSVDSMPVVSTMVDLESAVGTEAFFGFTAATGGITGDHRVTAWTPPALAAGPPVQSNVFGPFPLAFNGDADVINEGLSLTDNEAGRAGSAFSQDPVVLGVTTSFVTDFEFVFGGGSGGADGFAFLLHDDPMGAQALGATGGSLGYLGPFENLDSVFITPNVAVEFRTFTSNSVSIRISEGDTDTETTIAAQGESPFDLNGGMPLFARIEYDALTDLFEVFLKDDPLASFGPAFVSGFVDLFGLLGDDAFIGFSAATGGSRNEHVISAWTFETIASPPSVPEPATLLLLALGLAGLGFARRRLH